MPKTLSALLLPCLAACATGSTLTVTGNGPLALNRPKAPAEVKVFNQLPTDGSYVPVATIDAKQASINPDDSDAVLNKMIARAGEMGCDGLVLGVEDRFIGTSGTRHTYGWAGILEQLPENAYTVQTWYGVSAPTPVASPAQAAAGDHWTLEGYHAECLMQKSGS